MSDYEFDYDSARRILGEAASTGEIRLPEKTMDLTSKEGRTLISLLRWIVSQEKGKKPPKRAVHSPDDFTPPHTGTK